MHRRGFIKTIALAAVAVVVIGVIWYAAVQPSEGWPDESRRVVHPAGFSVVQPKGWDKYVDTKTSNRTSDSLRFLPAASVGNPGYFVATRVATPDSEEALLGRGYDRTTLLGRPAFEKFTEFKLTPDTLRDVVFERDGVWYDIAVRRPRSEPVTGGVWRAYADSFRVERVPPRPVLPASLMPSTTQPATAPATAASP